MNSTIAQLQNQAKFETLLNLIGDIAPQNAQVQKELSTLTNSKKNFIQKLQTQWASIVPPAFTAIQILEINQGYYDNLERTNEFRQVQGLPRIGFVESRNWVIKTENFWHGWSPETQTYYSDPLLFEGQVNFSKIFDPLVVSSRESGAVNMIWTVQKFLRQGTKMGLSQPNWAAVWLSLAKNYMPNEFQSLARYSEDPDALFIQLTAAINSEHESCKIRNSLVKVHRKPNEMVQSPLYQVKSNYEMLLAIEFPELDKSQISLRFPSNKTNSRGYPAMGCFKKHLGTTGKFDWGR